MPNHGNNVISDGMVYAMQKFTVQTCKSEQTVDVLSALELHQNTKEANKCVCRAVAFWQET